MLTIGATGYLSITPVKLNSKQRIRFGRPDKKHDGPADRRTDRRRRQNNMSSLRDKTVMWHNITKEK